MKQLACVALLLLTGCASMTAQTGRPKGPDGNVVSILVCGDRVEEARAYLSALGLSYADIVARLTLAQKECK